MPALTLDVALLHVDRADARGVCQIAGPDHLHGRPRSRARRSRPTCAATSWSRASIFAQADEARFVFWERALTTGVIAPALRRAPQLLQPAVRLRRRRISRSTLPARRRKAGGSGYRDTFLACTEQEYHERVGGLDAIRSCRCPPIESARSEQ